MALVEALQQRLARRSFLAAGMAAAGLLTLGTAGCDPAIMRRLRQIEARSQQKHGVWVWQFSEDGPAADIIETLAAYGLAAIVKTHDGVDWMAEYDPVPGAIAGPAQVATMASLFEEGGVPFHAWAVVKGIDPEREAAMAADVLDAGARSLTLDLEPGEGFWHGTPDAARRFGRALRARHEFARIDVSVDPRPWKLLDIPLAEFVEFCDGIAPQLYWDMFDDDHHANAYSYFGLESPSGSITPEFIVDATRELLAPYDRWIMPIGMGDPTYADAWPRFMRRCRERGMRDVSAWRYGTATADVLSALSNDL